MEILIHLTAGQYGGVETHVYYLSLALVAAGAQVTLVSQRKLDLNTDWTSSLKGAGVRIIRPPKIAKHLPGPLGLVASRIALLWRLRGKRFDLVIGQGHGGAYAWMRRFVQTGGQFLWHEYWYGVPMRADNYTEYKVPSPEKLSWKMQRMLDQLDGIVTGCERSRKNLIEIQNVRIPIQIIPPLTRIEPVSQATERIYNHDSILNITIVGRMGYGKGLGALLEVWKTLDIGKAHLHIYGPISSEFGHLMQQRYSNDKTITFHGSFDRANLPGILRESDIGLMLSIEEGYGLVVWEYMACGLPFVMTDCGAAQEFTSDNPDAILIPVSEEGVRDGITEMVRRVRSGQTSRIRLQEFHAKKFSFDMIAAQHVKSLLSNDT
jgi:glycosyltransferase involved in cell wall biosynthesis